MNINIKRKINSEITATQIVDYLLADRNIKNKKEFLNPPHPDKIKFKDIFSDDKFLINKLNKTLKLLKEIEKSGKMIIVYTDYDADGITGGAILWETLYLLGFKTMPYVPDRKTEGYGLSKKGIDHIKEKHNPGLIITVDHGIVAEEKIKYAEEIGIPVIVTDHHQKSDIKPISAFAVFHTDKLSGSGVAYFFSREIYQKYNSPQITNKQITNNFNNDYLSLAAIGTIADLVPLLGSSRSIVKYGLANFRQINRPGIRHLLAEAQIENRVITPYEIGYIIAPRINAFGRLTHGIDALRMLCTKHEVRAFHLANKAGQTNRQRQDLVEKAVKHADTLVNLNNKILIVCDDNWQEGIIGLIAGKIAEKYNRPTIALTKCDGVYKASARSISGFNIIKFLRKEKDHLIDIGGHPGAAGFTIDKNKLKIFIADVQKKAEKEIADKMLIPKVNVDIDLPLSSATLDLVKELEKLAPFGIGNPTPLFYSDGELTGANVIGKTKNHLKIYIKDNNSIPLELVFFGEGKQISQLLPGKKVGIVYSLIADQWNGRESVKGMGKKIVNL